MSDTTTYDGRFSIVNCLPGSLSELTCYHKCTPLPDTAIHIPTLQSGMASTPTTLYSKTYDPDL